MTSGFINIDIDIDIVYVILTFAKYMCSFIIMYMYGLSYIVWFI